MIRRRTLLAAAPLLAAPALARAQSGWRANYRDLRYGIISSENERDAIARLQGLAAYTERKLGVPMRITRGTDYAAVVEALRANQLEFAHLGPAAYALARRAMGERVLPLLRHRSRDGAEGYYSVIFVKADSPYQTLADLRGRSFAFADPNSTSGFAAPSYFLRKAGIEPSTYFSRTGFSGNHEQSVIAVLNGTYDSGATFWSNETAGNIQRMTEKGMIQPGTTRIIWRSPLIPNSPTVTRAEVPEDLRRDFVAMMKAMPVEAPEVLRQLSTSTVAFADARHEDYLDVIAITEDNQSRRRERRS
ncbi:phosphate/phosphite/phosphonate ABC transporter substrate-binding protein [Falsiroseomonas selenitidurans]|uniref:Phosphate/phosphite/phosphonate ABC transporter substrate-binding protein n=1 Tax=Falsiroseomonas selenitidurans TaxID=2716335 RepID=A0ABX1E5J7_9PROT|nr:phosphate/phosphite/phosphonate ABC transporter substrate-binding protein [Falsiroseomonas selenitidurans]NKC32462.1 phosphate/phosphite/phosphonate ABC transporter substrate-binding protein [Falsiroseomonas selenitidurans]